VPKGIAVALAVFAIAIAFSRRAPQDEHGNPLKALGIAAIGLVYVAVVPLVGYLVSITAIAGGAALYYGAPRKWGVLAFALGTAAVLWALFAWVLRIPMP